MRKPQQHFLLVTSALALVACASAPPAKVAQTTPQQMAAETAQTRRGTYWYYVDNITPIESPNGATPRVRLWVALPQNRNGQQVKLLKFDPAPAEIIEDHVSGNKLAFWSIENPSPGEPLIFRYDFEVQNQPIEFDIDPYIVQLPAATTPESQRYTISEPWLEKSNEIAAKAQEIVSDERNLYLRAQLLFDWVVEHVTYDYPDIKDRGVTRSFATLKGDCGEFSHIFITMARSLGIPARSVVANWYDGSGHMWAEIFLPPYGWIPVDTSVAQLVQNGLKGQLSKSSVQQFRETRGIPTSDPRWLLGNLYPHRLEVFVGTNVAFTAKTPGGTREFSFMQPGGSAAWPPGVLFDGLSPQTVSAGFFLFDAEANDEERARMVAEEQMAAGFLAAGLHQRAIAGLVRKIERSPTDSMSLFQLGQAYFNLRRYEAALEAFERSLKGRGGSLKRTTDTWSLIFRGMCFDALDRREEALHEYNSALHTGADYQNALDTAKQFIAEPYRPQEQ